MKLRLKDKPEVTGWATRFNMHGIGEVIMGFDGDPGGQDSMPIKDLEVFVPALVRWKDMSQAFQDRDIITDNYVETFGEPPTPADRERGWYD